MSTVSFAELVETIGLEDLASINRDEIANDFMPASVTGLADGDFVLAHLPYTGRKAELYGENHFANGLVAKAMADVAMVNGLRPGLVYDFQTFAAEYFVTNSLFAAYQSDSTVKIFPEVVTIDDNGLALKRPPSHVIDYGACLTSRSYLNDQMNFITSDQRPFVFSPLTRTHFTNQVLLNTYKARYGQDVARAIIDQRFYIGREDGIAAATDEMVSAQRAQGALVEVADIILATGMQHTTPEDMRRGIENGYSLLKEGGMLVIRALARPAVDEIGTDDLAGWAYEAGFPEKNTLLYEADLSNIGSILLGGHFGEREIRTAVLTK
ncbi:hypothetical protein KDA23_00625 [Candidatus Saccharibacteria bacterium]|nr:hypothetical protein [Candidatus Saccharibacteria bacterium]